MKSYNEVIEFLKSQKIIAEQLQKLVAVFQIEERIGETIGNIDDLINVLQKRLTLDPDEDLSRTNVIAFIKFFETLKFKVPAEWEKLPSPPTPPPPTQTQTPPLRNVIAILLETFRRMPRSELSILIKNLGTDYSNTEKSLQYI